MEVKPWMVETGRFKAHWMVVQGEAGLLVGKGGDVRS